MQLVWERDGCHAGQWHAMSEQTIFGGLGFVEQVIRHVLPGRIVGVSSFCLQSNRRIREFKRQRIISRFPEPKGYGQEGWRGRVDGG